MGGQLAPQHKSACVGCAVRPGRQQHTLNCTPILKKSSNQRRAAPTEKQHAYLGGVRREHQVHLLAAQRRVDVLWPHLQRGCGRG